MSTFLFIYLSNFRCQALNDNIVIHISCYVYVTEGRFVKIMRLNLTVTLCNLCDEAADTPAEAVDD